MRTKEWSSDGGKREGWVIECPGCECLHLFDARWSFNDNYDRPTFRPSMLVNASNASKRCHSFVTNGEIKFLPDSFHELRGLTIDLEDFTE